MKLKLPLFAKIVVWFFLNLLLLGIMAVIFLSNQFPLNFDLLLSGRTGARLHGMINVIGESLRSTPESEWDSILQRYSEAYEAKFLLFRMDGSQVAGERVELPTEVMNRITFGGRFTINRREVNPLERGEAFRREEEAGRGRPDEVRRRNGREDSSGPPPREFQGPPRPRFALRTSEPTQYWVGHSLGRGLGFPPTILVINSTTLDAGGLFFDWRPVILIGAVAIVLSVLFWIPLVGGITRSIKQMAAATNEISKGRFDVEAPANRTDELGQLGMAINSMANRLEWFVKGQRRFLGDIAHELCSPIARVQFALGVLEQRADEKQKQYVDSVREEVEHMTALVNELLAFSKASLGTRTASNQTVLIEELIRDCVRREASGMDGVQVEFEPGLKVVADPDLLKRAIGNLLRNAIRYAGSSGPIEIGTRSQGSEAIIRISDSGPGIPEEHLQRVFEAFYRVDPARSAETGGVGLGLAIVKTCVEASGGSVHCRNRQPTGLEVEIRLSKGEVG